MKRGWWKLWRRKDPVQEEARRLRRQREARERAQAASDSASTVPPESSDGPATR